ncbi:hypothetical protein GCM10023195_74450 [Actinoallomurus liliacearum]|uniref:HTH cro/C1-type domain-containing protein n=1 Tax=Actinoallomurus liliacearum TaxID=1080073 RepID=A0ABP8TXN3_9ACTN
MGVSGEHADPGAITAREDFARELTRLRESAGLTVRQVAQRIGEQRAHSTIGDWFAGRGLPSISSRELLIKVLGTCGVDDAVQVEAWLEAWVRVRREPGRRPGGPEPYRGLKGFTAEDAAWFFGRDAALARLLEFVGGEDGDGVRVVVGPSGAGKSSLLHAGLVAAVHGGALSGSAEWPVVLLTPGSAPVAALAAADRPGTRRLIVVDQFEELFTAGSDEEEQERFISALDAAARERPGAVVVVGLRADFYGHALRRPLLEAAVRGGQFTVGPMREAELREVITAPARQARLDIEDGLVELLLREVTPRRRADSAANEAGALPLLSHALYSTWDHSRNRRLTIADYRAVGGIDGAVAATAEAVYGSLTAAERETARRLFLSLVHVAEDTADTRRRLTMTEVRANACPPLAGLGPGGPPPEGHAPEDPSPADPASAVDEVLARFVQQRLITADTDTVSIAHDAVLSAWPRLHDWLNADRAGLLVGRRLAEAASAWRREGDDPAALYSGTRLAVAREWVAGAGPRAVLTPLVREFLEASATREYRERFAARRRSRRLRLFAAALAALLVLASAALGVAVHNGQVIRDERNSALSGKVANEATALGAANPALAAQLALAAYRLAPTPEARGSLLSTTASPYATRLTAHTAAVYAAVFSPDGRTLATAGLDHTARLWDVADPHRPTVSAVLTGHTDGVTSVAFSPDGRLLVTGGGDHTARLWDVADPHRPAALAVLTGHTDGIRSVAFSPDGRTVATASYDRTARLWDVTDPHHPVAAATLTGHRQGLAAVAFGPDGRTLATTAYENTVRLWDVSHPYHPAALAQLNGHTDRVLSAAFSPDGHTLATGSFDSTIRLWNVTDPRHVRTIVVLAGHGNGVVALAFSPDGRELASGSYDRTIRLWNVADPADGDNPAVLRGHAATVYAVAFSPDGAYLASGGGDETSRVWDLRSPILADHPGAVDTLAFSPDGRTLATGSYRAAELDDVTTPDRPVSLAVLDGHTDGVLVTAFTPDRRTLVTSGLDGALRLWNLTAPGGPALLATRDVGAGNILAGAISPDGRTLALVGESTDARLWDLSAPGRPAALATLTGHGDSVTTVAFSLDGHTLATGSSDRTARLWDVTDRLHPIARAVITGHTAGVNAVAFGPDGHTLATGGSDGTARLWNVTDTRHPTPLATITGHADSITTVAFSPDGHTLATGSNDRTARLWNVTDTRHPTPLATITGHADGITTVAFSPDGHTLATGSSDGTARLWNLDAGDVARRVCARSFPAVTPEEWAQHFPGIAYTPPCH